MFGSVASPLGKEVPRFPTFRRAGIALWHECADADIAVWLSRLDRLREMRRRINRALPVIINETGVSVAFHQIDIFVPESESVHYLGRMCQFKACPAGKTACLVPGCGATPFLQQHVGFVLHPDALGPARAVRPFDRATGRTRHAVDLPGPPEDQNQRRPYWLRIARTRRPGQSLFHPIRSLFERIYSLFRRAGNSKKNPLKISMLQGVGALNIG